MRSPTASAGASTPFAPTSSPTACRPGSPSPTRNAALQRLATRYRLGILSNVDDDLIAGTLKHFNGVHFDLVVTAQQVNAYKPAYAHFEVARRRLGVARWLHAAQSYFHDVVPATALKLPVVWVNRKDEAQCRRPAAHAEVRDLAGLADYLGPRRL